MNEQVLQVAKMVSSLEQCAFIVYSRLYIMRDARKLWVKTSKISKLCIKYRA